MDRDNLLQMLVNDLFVGTMDKTKDNWRVPCKKWVFQVT